MTAFQRLKKVQRTEEQPFKYVKLSADIID